MLQRRKWTVLSGEFRKGCIEEVKRVELHRTNKFASGQGE